MWGTACVCAWCAARALLLCLLCAQVDGGEADDDGEGVPGTSGAGEHAAVACSLQPVRTYCHAGLQSLLQWHAAAPAPLPSRLHLPLRAGFVAGDMDADEYGAPQAKRPKQGILATATATGTLAKGASKSKEVLYSEDGQFNPHAARQQRKQQKKQERRRPQQEEEEGSDYEFEQPKGGHAAAEDGSGEEGDEGSEGGGMSDDD